MPKGKILAVVPDAAHAAEQRHLLEIVDHASITCLGPTTRRCPVLEGKECDLVSEAHGILFELDLDNPAHRDVLSRYKEILPDDVPVRVVVHPGQEKTYHDLLTGLEVRVGDPGIADIDGFAAEVEAADSSRDT